MNEVVVSPDRGTYHPGELVRIAVAALGRNGGRVDASVSHLTTEVAQLQSPLGEDGRAVLEWSPPLDSPRGYGIDLRITGPGDQSPLEAATAFDVLSHWTLRPRYGFITDFTPGRRVDVPLETLLPFHINALQFYDWQYRHDQLVAPSADYQDPLGRSLSLDTVRRLVQFARSRGIGAMAYAAVYAASVDFQRQNPRWALFDATGQPLAFEGFLGYMDPSSRRPWSDHLLDQCDRAMTEVGFDGIHLDQYGEPRRAFDSDGDEVDLPAAFSNFVADLKRRRPEASVTLNAVKNWPMEELSASCEDFYYVELWPDMPSYPEVECVVRKARESGNGKQVVVALYVPAERESNVRLVDAMILAAGGTRIELGEDRRLLADPYFPKHEQISTELGRALVRYWDTAVRYGDLLFDREAPEASTLEVEGPDGVWTGPYQSQGWLVVALVNFCGLEDVRWDRAHPPPDALVDAEVRIRCGPAIVGVWWVDPDGQSARPQPLGRQLVGGSTVVVVPSLRYWGLLLLEIEDEVGT